MVHAKGKALVEMSSVTGDPLARKKVARTKFKVYSDREDLKTEAAVESSLKSVHGNTVTINNAVKDVKVAPKNMENIKGPRDSFIKSNARRKPLADVSNAHTIALSEVICDGSKPMKYKRNTITSVNRDLKDLGVKNASALTRKPTVVQIRGRQSQNNRESFPSKRGEKESFAISHAPRTKMKEPCSRPSYTDNGRTRINYLPLARKSLPVLKRNNQENSESSAKGMTKISDPIKSKISNKVIPRASNIGSHISKSGASDGHMISIKKVQANTGAYASCAKPSVRSMNNVTVAPSTRKMSKSKFAPVADESTSVFAISSGNNKSETIPAPEDTASNVSKDYTNQETLSVGTSLPKENKSDVNIKRKAGRRRSYTSLLMARSKFLEEHGEVMEQEKIPNIDDGCNQLEVAEYVDEIYEYYWIAEVQFFSLNNYMSIQGEITSSMRGILINWLIEVHHKFDLMHETLYLMVTLLDRYLSQVPIQKNEMQLVGLTALLLASKYEDFWHPRIKDLISISAESYTREQMLSMESSILKKLKFRLNVPTPYVFMLRFLKAAQSDKVLEHLSFYLIELCLVEYKALEFKSSLLCASAIYLARLTLQISPTWTPLLVKHARYEVPDMRQPAFLSSDTSFVYYSPLMAITDRGFTYSRDCAEMILGFHKSAGKGQLKVTHEKYAGSNLSSAAMILPLETLPAI
ncbi:hypothetical protein SAY87_014131 [Trapa incisa]|uniref:B-like cyclin n=1 Tax=Trapa incisa TaxID=236973 RepID=A0AAN7GJM1_9MYRT|nr:hypothetical protein SAY87_014131 [Trapa incisa]